MLSYSKRIADGDTVITRRQPRSAPDAGGARSSWIFPPSVSAGTDRFVGARRARRRGPTTGAGTTTSGSTRTRTRAHLLTPGRHRRPGSREPHPTSGTAWCSLRSQGVTVIVNEPVSDSPLDLPKSERDPRLVQARRLLRGTGALLPRRERRRHRRPQGPDVAARLPAVAGHRLHLAAARSSSPRCATAATTWPTTPTSCPSSATSATSSSSSRQAHARGIRVIIDFVMNHTSDQHPWFQASRTDPQGPYGDYYIWADDDKQFMPDARIIFVDTETSNWSFDPVRKQYYWHRFFSHQPDLNYDNPRVQRGDPGRAAVLAGPRHRRLPAGRGALPLPARGHQLREPAGDARVPQAGAGDGGPEYPDRVLLAEANQWPADVVDYFGDPTAGGDECHMAFHFPVMPRIFMAVRARIALPRSPRSWPRPRPSRTTPSGASSCATTTS